MVLGLIVDPLCGAPCAALQLMPRRVLDRNRLGPLHDVIRGLDAARGVLCPLELHLLTGAVGCVGSADEGLPIGTAESRGGMYEPSVQRLLLFPPSDDLDNLPPAE